MFLSSDDLKLAYGVDLEIGKFYVDRRVPGDNAYWQKRHLYIISQPGYVFMPIYADLLYRIGIPKTEVLGEAYTDLMEKVMDSAARQEIENFTLEDHIAECIGYAKAVSVNPLFLKELVGYFNGEKSTSGIDFGYPFPALGRADAFLFSLCVFEFDISVARNLVDAWTSLMTFFLVKDDLTDIKEDLKNNEPNAVLEAGLDDNGAGKIAAMLDRSHDLMLKFNPVMANRIDHTRSTADIKKIISEILVALPHK